MEFKGTKGQWVHVKGYWHDTVECQGAVVCTMGRPSMNIDELDANSCLVAAAPDLLKACMDFIEKVDSGRARSVKTYGQMKAAVEKALGKSFEHGVT